MQRAYVIGNLDRIEEIDEEIEELENSPVAAQVEDLVQDLLDERERLVDGICEELYP